MRVYELAKELGVDSKELIVKLKKLNFPVKSHMSAIDDDAVQLLKEDISDLDEQEIKDNVIEVAKELEVPHAFMQKHRDPYTHQIELKDTGFDCNNKDVLLIDDVITSGGTATKAAEIIIKKKPASLTFFSIHALSKPDVFKKLRNIGVSEIISTNTIPRTDISQIDVSLFISNFIEEKFL